MTERSAFDREMDELALALAAMRGSLDYAAARFSTLAKRDMLPDAALFGEAASELAAGSAERLRVERRIARLIGGFSGNVNRLADQFEHLQMQRLSGAGNASWLSRLRTAFSHRDDDGLQSDGDPGADGMRLLLRAERLNAMLEAERSYLASSRDQSESELAGLVASRARLTGLLRQADPASSSQAAAGHVENVLAHFEDLVDEINTRLAAFVVLQARYAADCEQLLVLLRAMASDGLIAAIAPADYPSLADDLERMQRGMVAIAGLEERRAAAERDFWEWFPPEVLVPRVIGKDGNRGRESGIAAMIARSGEALSESVRDRTRDVGNFLRRFSRP